MPTHDVHVRFEDDAFPQNDLAAEDIRASPNSDVVPYPGAGSTKEEFLQTIGRACSCQELPETLTCRRPHHSDATVTGPYAGSSRNRMKWPGPRLVARVSASAFHPSPFRPEK